MHHEYVSCVCSFSQDILNHVISDLEIFMGKVSAAANASSSPKDSKSKSKKKSGLKKKKSKKNGKILFSLRAHIIINKDVTAGVVTSCR